LVRNKRLQCRSSNRRKEGRKEGRKARRGEAAKPLIMLRFAVQNGYHDTTWDINIMKRPGNSHGGFVHCLKKRKCCRNRTEKRSNTTHVKKRLQQLFIVSSAYNVDTVADILRGVAQPSLRSNSNGPEHDGGTWGSWPWGRPKEGGGSMLERRGQRVSKLLNRTKSTLPRISLPHGESAAEENLATPLPLTSTVDQPLHMPPFPASNAIPFTVSTPPPDYIEESLKAVLTQEAAQEAAQEVTPILPWLYRACGRIGEFFHSN
jgi:hypothetical protein